MVRKNICFQPNFQWIYFSDHINDDENKDDISGDAKQSEIPERNIASNNKIFPAYLLDWAYGPLFLQNISKVSFSL